jgi:hypothetical protein
MKTFAIAIQFSDPFPKRKEYRESATQFDFAVKKALRQFRKDFKGKRIKSFSVQVTDLGGIPKGSDVYSVGGGEARTNGFTSDEVNKKVLDRFFQFA